MKIKIKKRDFEKVSAMPKPTRFAPLKPLSLLRLVIRIASIPDLLATRFEYTAEGCEILKREPCLILMNHSSFLDLEIAHRIFRKTPFCIVSTHDGLVGKKLLMRLLGCIPTKKFVSDTSLIGDMRYALKELGTSVLMFPEAGYSFDGTSTALPARLSFLAKKLDVPVITVTTHGAFLRQPLYNNLKKRRVKASAAAKLLFTREDYKTHSIDELDAMIAKEFSFDEFAYQAENGIEIKESFRADGLERILYKCPACKAEGATVGAGTKLICHACGKEYELDKLGRMGALSGESEFPHIPDWYEWERDEVRREIEAGEYLLDCPVDVYVLRDYKALYSVGEGRLTHNADGFVLTGCDGKLNYTQSALSSYSLNSDYYWYELGDVIGIGDSDMLYYCIPKEKVSVAKVRLAAEEIYKIKISEKRRARV